MQNHGSKKSKIDTSVYCGQFGFPSVHTKPQTTGRAEKVTAFTVDILNTFLQCANKWALKSRTVTIEHRWDPTFKNNEKMFLISRKWKNAFPSKAMIKL